MTPKPASGFRRGLPGALAALALAGQGLLLWIGLSAPLLHSDTLQTHALRGPQRLMLGVGMVLAALALTPFVDARWQTRRTRKLAATLLLAGGLLAWQLHVPHPDSGWLAIDGMAVVVVAILAMLDLGLASAARPTSLQAPLGMSLGLYGGVALLSWLAAETWAGGGLGQLSASPPLLLMVPAVALKLADWHAQDLLRPLSRERIAALVLAFALPLACVLTMAAFPAAAHAAWRLAAPALLAGLMLERAEPALRPAAAGTHPSR